MTKKQIRGLFDYMELEAGEDWEFAPLSETFVHGMGLGATAEATRWAYKGYLQELGDYAKALKKKAGRKALPRHAGIDCDRAKIIWMHVNQFKDKTLISLKNRHLIMEMQSMGRYNKHIATLFPMSHGRLESSVSKGKKILEIDENWNSKVCEKLMSD